MSNVPTEGAFFKALIGMLAWIDGWHAVMEHLMVNVVFASKLMGVYLSEGGGGRSLPGRRQGRRGLTSERGTNRARPSSLPYQLF